MIPTLHVDLTQPPDQRWDIVPALIDQSRTMLAAYLSELSAYGDLLGMINTYAATFLQADHYAEIRALAKIVDRPVEEVLLGNLYYDALKFVWGCTAFAIDTPKGPIHARNLDWFSVNDTLRDFTVITRYTGGKQGEFSTVGWPGYIGALSGIAPGRFAISLNAVISQEPATLAKPISLFIRTVLERAANFSEAVSMLQSETIAADCLLLISGVNNGEMVVIERTPTKSATRYPENGYITVTNDYLKIDSNTGESTNMLLSTSCNRYDRACEMLNGKPPTTPQDCFSILSDPKVRMMITVQHMVFQASSGLLRVRLPS